MCVGKGCGDFGCFVEFFGVGGDGVGGEEVLVYVVCGVYDCVFDFGVDGEGGVGW